MKLTRREINAFRFHGALISCNKVIAELAFNDSTGVIGYADSKYDTVNNT